ncbi:MAG: hypothetical protein KIT18_12520 [Burkholderiales bacterium]|nr:hypothetical protein [Burkholderiales bacterium]
MHLSFFPVFKPMLAKLDQHAALLAPSGAKAVRHLMMVLPKTDDRDVLRGVPCLDVLERALSRRGKKLVDLADTPLECDLPAGTLASWVMLDGDKPAFERQTALRKAMQPLLAEKPEELAIAVFGDAGQRRRAAELAVYAAWVNGVPLPHRKKKQEEKPLRRISMHGHRAADGFAALRAQAEGNTLCRELTVLPPNELTPGAYRRRIARLAKRQGWRHEEYGMKRLRKMGAGAFVAVAQGSAEEDAAIVHLRYRHRKAKKTVALVGKGICFDTGGHNLKPARYTCSVL